GHDLMAKAFMAKQDYASAIGELKSAIVNNPTNAAQHRVLGQALLLENQLEDAVRELRIAVQLDPDSAPAHHYYGTALFETQAFESALVEFRESVRLDPTADNHYFLAACLISMGRDDDALGELEIASRLEPGKTLYRARKEELMK